jgi:AcrR family transcriptional regulator
VIWARAEPGARRPRYTREEIAATALEIADADGFEAVSMRRVAAELGAGTMTLYHYVRTKDELIALMDDAIMGEVLVPEGELSSDWREALAQVARRSRDAFVRHPWAFEALQGARVGPNGMRHFEQSLEAVSGLDVPIEERFELVALVDDYVLGHVVHRFGPRGQPPRDDEIIAGLDYIVEQLRTGDYPRVSELMGEEDARATWERVGASAMDEGRFERGLQRLLDGIGLDLERRGKA